MNQEVRGLVLSGGRGTRLRPFTYALAKQLIPVANKPIIAYAVEALVKAGVSDIGIVTGDTAAQVRQTLGKGSQFHAKFTYIHQGEALGISHAVLAARDFLQAAPFVLFLGDNLVPRGIARQVQKFRETGPDAQILLKPVSNPEEFGIALLDDHGRPVRLLEKPAAPPTNLAITGIYMFGPRFFEAASQIQPSPRGELEITDAIQKLIDLGADVRAEQLTDDWIDAGRLEDVLAANRLMLEELQLSTDAGIVEGSTLRGPVVLQDGARVTDSVIDGPAIIGKNAEIVASRIGPYTSIGASCLLRQSDVEDSVVLEDAAITASGPLRHCLIGRDVEIRGLGGAGPLTLTLGDCSKVVAS
jgi:glucose-1-phosphate thymidylyltransferase